ncbi:MAG: bifunctional 4-hydroxy-2-oxoglutarate aldolase/2-dehydro-3-deoxy-phosphogluconate aldolase [Verrucomicrobia bacterium]|nr:bifunctional 4-hydroxy-2-oxoglutarate aldolase/2-dehydro-3-deoxy-phosphogluconate aldolase [Verrucomicrobiota bacterium]MBM3870112.1 bifunctional 4-hydroxy-2-oxoglutarate aldolase/2-dehydro-3-deoxy-phosphogluconate aldolase [Verrucomicrobiota bacterium]
MRTQAEISSHLTQLGVIAVIRTPRPEQVLPLCAALVEGGLTALEITFTVPNACNVVAAVVREFGGHATVGVGTVLTALQLKSALDAGAEFFVTPILRPELVPLAHAAGRPIMLGSYTPTEAQLAHEAGADFVKLFPADNHGPKGVRAFCAPLPHLRIVPTGGVTLANAGEFIKAGCAAVGVGSTLLTTEILAKNDWSALQRLAADYIATVQAARAS